MFKLLKRQRIQEIADMVPEWISNLSVGGSGYNSKIGKMITFMQISKVASELGIKIPLMDKFDISFVPKLLAENKIPDLYILKTSIGRLRVSFYGLADVYDPIIDLEESFGEECTNGCIYVVSTAEVPLRDLNGLKKKGVIKYKNLITGKVINFEDKEV